MAGIGFELRRILRRKSYLAIAEAYGYAGLVSSGPWLLSIFGILLLGFLAATGHSAHEPIIEFQVSVTYLIAGSLILTGPMQLLFTRYVADMLFARQSRSLATVMISMLIAAMALGAVTAAVALLSFFTKTPWSYQLLMAIAFVELCGVWILTIMSTSLKDYRLLVTWYLVAYGTIVVLGLVLGRRFGLDGYLLAFISGPLIILLGLGVLVIREYPGTIQWPEKRSSRFLWTLSLVGVSFNLAIWVDKFWFWFYPTTSAAVIGPLRMSPLYDVPVFLSYLLIVPGLAVFLFRLETDFVEYYESFNRAIIEGGNYNEIRSAKLGMIQAARTGLWDIAKVQGITILLAFSYTKPLLASLGYSESYARIFQFDVVGASLQLLLMSLLNICFYLDLRSRSVTLVLIFLILNMIFTWLSLQAGPFFYGLGFLGALLVACIVGLYFLAKDLPHVDYLMFMHERDD
jgi:uncharacterized membrane protein